MLRLPIIGVTACTKQVGLHPNHIVGDKYVRAVAVGAEALPLVIPALGELIDHDTLLASVDGLLFTGSPSNVEPHHYSGPASMPGTHHDIFRDATTLPLIRTVIDMGMPLFGVCRGFQEINVVMGGTLHQHIQELPGKMDHREPPEGDIPTLYADAHEARLMPDSLLKQWLGGTDTITINSLHQQGVKDLGRGLTVEALAPDGIVEAFRIDAARHFGYAVQWHPEWLFDEKKPSIALFKAFREACEAYKAGK